MTRPVVIRTDASAQTGFGHLARCLSLASALQSFGGAITFLMRAPAPGLPDRLSAQGFGLERLDERVEPGSDEDAAATTGLIRGVRENCILIVDHYAIDYRWEGRQRAFVRKLAVIDDLADRRHDCDMLINQNRIFDGEAIYRGRRPEECLLFVGPKYAMLRQEFAERRPERRSRDGRIGRVFICFGGSDSCGHTQTALRSLTPFLGRLHRVDVIVGPLNESRDELAILATTSEKIALHVDPPDLAGLMDAADLAIGAGGVMSWERACLSVPTLAFGIVQNQFQNVRDLIRVGAAVGEPEMVTPCEAAFTRWLAVLMDSPELVRGMAERAGGLVDGWGSRRVAGRLIAGQLTFRPARPADALMIYSWRNDPATRAVSGDSQAIPVETHQRWFEASLLNPSRIILIGEIDGSAVGVVRFDVLDKNATMSVFKDPAYSTSSDIVGQASRWLFDNRPDLNQISAIVLAANERSMRAFEAAGYVLAERHYVLRRSEYIAPSDLNALGVQ